MFEGVNVALFVAVKLGVCVGVRVVVLVNVGVKVEKLKGVKVGVGVAVAVTSVTNAPFKGTPENWTGPEALDPDRSTEDMIPVL